MTLYGLTISGKEAGRPGVRVVTLRQLFHTKGEAMSASGQTVADVERTYGPLNELRIEIPEFEAPEDTPSRSLARIDQIIREGESDGAGDGDAREVGPAIVEGMGEGHFRRNLDKCVGLTVKGFDYKQGFFAIHFAEGGFVMLNIAPDGRNLQISFPSGGISNALEIVPERVM